MPDLLLGLGLIVLAETVILASIVLLIDRMAAKRQVALRHDAALMAMLSVPLLFLFPLLPSGGAIDQEIIPIQTYITPALQTLPPAGALFEGAAGNTADAVSGTVIAAPSRPSLAAMLVSLWIAGSVFFLLRLAADMICLRRLVQQSTPLNHPIGLALSAKVSLRCSDEISSPMVAGFFNPVILLPAEDVIDDSLIPVLEHEIAHIRRRDIWVTLALRFIIALFWWNLPLYPLHAIVRREREKLCDSYAIEQGGARLDLAEALLRTAERQVRRRQPSLSMAAAVKGSGLVQRLHRLSEKDQLVMSRHHLAVAIIPALVSLAFIAGPRGLAAQEGTAQEVGWNVTTFEEKLERALAQDHGDDDEDREDWLYFAAVRGDRDRVISLIDEGYDPDYVSHGDGTPLIGAVRSGDIEIVRILLEKGANPNVVAPGDGSPLISAARLGEATMVDMLLAGGADPNVGVGGDGLPLISAARRGDMAIIETLLAAGADPDLGIGGDGNALIGAALGGHPQAVRRLLDAGADPNGYVYGDETPLINAAHAGHIDVAEVLVAAGADVSLTVISRKPEHNEGVTEWRSPISEAKRTGQNAMVRWLEERGARHQPQD